MAPHHRSLWLVVALSAGLARAQDAGEGACYGPGSIALAVILSVVLTAALLAGLVYLWRKYRKPKELILETDPEKGKAEYAFDNPGFKDPGYTPIAKALEKDRLEGSKAKWAHWSPLSALTVKSEKKKTLDDSAIDGKAVKVVALRSHDFTGLGFNICGNMKEGIYIKDVLHRGPASESGKLNPGDRINSVTISFEHMVYEDALTILSYASPYEVIIEARGGKIIHQTGSGQGAQPSHPVYRSSSCTDLFQVGSTSKRRLFATDEHTGSVSSNYSSLQKSRSNMTTLERKDSESPKNVQTRAKKVPPKTQMSPEQLKNQLEQKILADHQNNLKTKNEKPARVEAEVQKTENKLQKFGIRVLPSEKSPKSAELSQNDNNINLEKQPVGVDEVDDKKPQVKKRERKVTPDRIDDSFVRDSVLNGSGVKRDANGIPQEIPNYMMNAAVAARTNRRGSEDREEVEKTPKKTKGKAPAPPEEKPKEVEKLLPKNNLDEIQAIGDDFEEALPKTNIENLGEEIEVELRSKANLKDYNSDSDIETDNQSSVNTIELNSSDITIHHAEDNEDRQNRRTASTGDLTKIQRTRKSSSGTLERAQSLDITDTSIPTLSKKRKGGRIEDDMGSQEDIFGKVMTSKEPRLSLILDGLNTFQRNRLKKSTEWGNLEDAILKVNQEDESFSSSNQNMSLENINFNLGGKTVEFDALVNKINEIKRESMDQSETIKEENVPPIKPDKKVKNQIWPTFELDNNLNKANGSAIAASSEVEDKIPVDDNPRLLAAEKRQRKPPLLEPKESPLPVETVTVEKKITKPAVPEKKDFLLSSPKKVSSYVPEKEEVKVITSEEKPSNKSDEGKTETTHPVEDVLYVNLIDLTRNFIFTEKVACSQDEDRYGYLSKDDINISDDIKVSRHSLGSLERPKSDDAKMNVSNITVNNLHTQDEENLHSLEMTVNEPSNMKTEDVSELYTTALDSTIKPVHNDASTVTISTPDIIKNVTITEAINKLNNDVTIHGPSSLTLEIPSEPELKPEENKFSVDVQPVLKEVEPSPPETTTFEDEVDYTTPKNNSSLTYITEIQVLTPNNTNPSTNISEIEIIPNINSNGRNLDHEFEDYVRNFESNVKNFESNIQKFENRFDSPPKPDVKSIIITDNDAEKELHKIHEIAEEQLKKLPEMRFTTSSYESPRTPEKRQSQIELLRSNFEKSPPKNSKPEPTSKSRIPIATTTKTPPTSPERRDSRNLDLDNDKDIMELMSSTVHSTPMVSHSKYQIKPPNKNVTVTSIRSNSKIPSGLPVLGGGSRPAVPPRKHDDDHVVQVSTNGGTESSFKQWVFNPADHSVTNIVVADSKQQK